GVRHHVPALRTQLRALSPAVGWFYSNPRVIYQGWRRRNELHCGLRSLSLHRDQRLLAGRTRTCQGTTQRAEGDFISPDMRVKSNAENVSSAAASRRTHK